MPALQREYSNTGLIAYVNSYINTDRDWSHETCRTLNILPKYTLVSLFFFLDMTVIRIFSRIYRWYLKNFTYFFNKTLIIATVSEYIIRDLCGNLWINYETDCRRERVHDMCLWAWILRYCTSVIVLFIKTAGAYKTHCSVVNICSIQNYTVFHKSTRKMRWFNTAQS
jgi:small-conductance mechanosensitive channel